MASTNHGKIEFGRPAYMQWSQSQQSTYETSRSRADVIKMMPSKKGPAEYSGSRKINYSEQNIRKAYLELNKRLGGLEVHDVSGSSQRRPYSGQAGSFYL